MTPVRSRRGAWLPGGRGRRLTNDTARQSVSIIIMPHFFNTNNPSCRDCPFFFSSLQRPKLGQTKLA